MAGLRGSAPAVPIHGAGYSDLPGSAASGRREGSTVAVPLAGEACPRFVSVSSADCNQPPVDVQIAVDLSLRRETFGDARAPSGSESRAQRGIAREPQRARFQLGVCFMLVLLLMAVTIYFVAFPPAEEENDA
jgi:hypothetical protein